jgi:hypothetical protein
MNSSRHRSARATVSPLSPPYSPSNGNACTPSPMGSRCSP